MFPQKRAPKKSCNKNFPNKSHQIESKSHKNLTKFHQTSRGQDAKMRCIAVGISPQRKITSFRCAKYSRPPRVLQWKSSKCGMVMWVWFNWLQNHENNSSSIALQSLIHLIWRISEEKCWRLWKSHVETSDVETRMGISWNIYIGHFRKLTPNLVCQHHFFSGNLTAYVKNPHPEAIQWGVWCGWCRQAGDMRTTEVLASRILRIRNRGTVARLEWPPRALICMCNCHNTIIIHTVKCKHMMT